jgi:hypothetical protein
LLDAAIVDRLFIYNQSVNAHARHSEWWEPEMDGLKQCQDDHRRLANIASRLTNVLARDRPPPASELYALRQELVSTLIRHLKAEDWLLYPKLMRSPDPRISQIAQSFVNEMGGLALTFRNHSERWAAYAIESDWPGYRRETAQLLIALNERIMREDRDLYPLCDGSATSLGVCAG